MKKVLLILLSILCVCSNSMNLFAEELSDEDMIIVGRAGEFKLGDVVELPMGLNEDEEVENRDFLVIGKDEDGRNTVTLMALENLMIDEDNGTEDGLKFTTQTSNISYANSTVSDYCNYVSTKVSDEHQYFSDRMVEVNKSSSGNQDSAESYFFFPSLTELGFTSASSSGRKYSLFNTKDVITYMNDNSIDTDKEFSIWTRDLDTTKHLVYAVDHNITGGIVSHDYSTQDGLNATHNFGVCLVVSYDEEPETLSSPQTKNVKLYTSLPSEYYVSIPTKVMLSSSGTTTFNISVYGDLQSNEYVKISTDKTTTLLDTYTGDEKKSGITVDASLSEGQVDFSDVQDGGICVISVDLTPEETITAGNWEVDLPITIAVEQ